MAYLIHGYNIQTKWGIIAIKPNNSDLALSGFLDLPARLGKCYHSWGATHGVEPYTNASEIRLGGRDLVLLGAIMGANRQECIEKLNAFYKYINDLNSLIEFASPYSAHQVYVKEPVIGEYLGETGLRIMVTMREPEPVVDGSIPQPTGEYGIDGIDWSSFGAVLISLEGDRRNRPSGKDASFTAYRKEGWGITKTEAGKLNMKLYIKQSTYQDFANKIGGLQQLFIKPGERNLIVKEDLQRRVFACNGFKVTDIRNNDGWYGMVQIELIESQIPQIITYLADNAGNYIIDNSNNKILIKWQ